MKHISKYIEDCLANGRFFFEKEEALQELRLSQVAFNLQALRLSKKKLIKKLRSGLFMIIPHEYRNFGTVPPHWLIDPLMRHLKQNYYVGLLTAASLYGATHQQPIGFHVITTKVTKCIHLDKTTIYFHVSRSCLSSKTTPLTTPAGYTYLSTKAQTILDLVFFHQTCGYFSNVAMVIKELSENIDIKDFDTVIANEARSHVLQRLGYILEILGYPKLANRLDNALSKRSLRLFLLRPDLPKTKLSVKSKRWNLVINDTLEIEE